VSKPFTHHSIPKLILNPNADLLRELLNGVYLVCLNGIGNGIGNGNEVYEL
jgi:hypothetical protein